MGVAPALTVSVPAPGMDDGAWDWSGLPVSAGVIVLEDGDGRTVLIATTGNIRSWAQRRFQVREPGQRSARAELRGIVRFVRACEAGSRFEADLAYLALARERMASAHRSVTDRWQGWFVHVDPVAEHPNFVKAVTRSLGDDSWRAGTLIGPFGNKHAAGRAMDVLTDLFDLCRYHHLLVQSPCARACAYKEMGKCPAPCDGSETLESYRGRVEAACVLMRGGVEVAIESTKERMHRASVDQDFEQAAMEKRLVDGLQPLLKRGCVWARTLDVFSLCAVAQGGDARTARLFAIGAGGVERVADVGVDAALGVWEDAAQRCRACSERLRTGFDWGGESLDTLGLVCDRLYSAQSRTRFGGVAFAWCDGGISGETVRTLARRVLGGGDTEEDDGLEIILG